MHDDELQDRLAELRQEAQAQLERVEQSCGEQRKRLFWIRGALVAEMLLLGYVIAVGTPLGTLVLLVSFAWSLFQERTMTAYYIKGMNLLRYTAHLQEQANNARL